MTDDPDVLELRVTNAPVGTKSLLLRMSPELVDEVRAKLDEAGLDHGEVLEFSAGAQLMIEMVQIAVGSGAALGGLAAVIRSVTHRNDGKKVRLKDGEEFIGYSREDTAKLIEKYWDRQQENEAGWKRQIEKDKGEDENDL